jgi:hypothetical protein
VRPRRLNRRALLRGGAIGVAAAAMAGCTATEPEPVVTEPPDPQVVLLRQIIAEKERTVALYEGAASKEPALRPFLERHRVHLTELSRRLPRSASPAPPATPAATATPGAAATATPAAASRTKLREVERKAASARTRQVTSVSPPLAQLLASIGACEAAHAFALSRPL